MSTFGDTVAKVATLDAGPGRVVALAPAPSSLTGLDDFERNVCRPLDPAELPPIGDDPTQPLADRILHAGRKWMEFASPRTAKDIGSIVFEYYQTLLKMTPQQTDEYVEAALKAYSDYVLGYFAGYGELFLMMLESSIRAAECGEVVANVTVEALLGVDTAASQEFVTSLTQLMGACAPLVHVLNALVELHTWFQVLAQHPIDAFGAAVEVVVEFAVAAVEKLADSAFIEALREFANDHWAIGELHGTLVGVIMAEVIIDEVLTLGVGKAVRGVRTTIKGAM